jgi:glycosyltransferase involved in cell wall biosynthesis
MKPFVSCLMISRPSTKRWQLFQASVRSFQEQKYEPKELIILLNHVSKAQQKKIKSYIKDLNDPRIRLKTISSKHNLGELRNRIQNWARGNLLAQWDDDDISHPLRLTKQIKFLQKTNADAVVLGTIYHVFLEKNQIHFENWQEAHLKGSGFPSSILYRKTVRLKYVVKGHRSNRGEDLDFLRRLSSNPKINVSSLWLPHPVYAYIYHGLNQWKKEHHLKLVQYFSSGILSSHHLPHWISKYI